MHATITHHSVMLCVWILLAFGRIYPYPSRLSNCHWVTHGFAQLHAKNTALYSLSGRTTAVSREALKPRDSGLDFSNRSDIRNIGSSAAEMTVKFQSDDYHNIPSCGFDTSRNLAVKRLTALWIRAQNDIGKCITWTPKNLIKPQ